ncbi:MAG: ABC transporter permease [Proteobacteria bacterium]|nr:ABC transporter permease [Pseudomonadota bacterium]
MDRQVVWVVESGATSRITPASQASLLRKDLVESLRNWRFWIFLGWNDIARQYRRSFVGPLWIVFNSAFFIVAFGFIGAQLFKLPVADYLPYFCAGHIFFGFISALINEGCMTYIQADAFLKQMPYPKLTFVFRLVWRNVIMLAHNLAVLVAVLLWSGHFTRVWWFQFLAAVLLTLVCACAVVAILGALAARFRDIPMAVASVMQISFFVTPVMWRSEQLTERARMLVHLNPLAAFLEILRAPLLGAAAASQAWMHALIATVLALAFFGVLYLRARRRIIYWL